MEVYLATTEYSTSQTYHFSSRNPEVPWLEVIRASMAIPVAYGKKVRLQEREFIDGELSSPIADSIRLAIQKGAHTVIAIDNSNSISSLSTFKPFGKALYDFNILRALGIRAYKMFPYPKFEHLEARVVLIQPSRTLPTHLYNNHPEAIAAAMKLGYMDVRDNPSLNALFNKRAQPLAA